MKEERHEVAARKTVLRGAAQLELANTIFVTLYASEPLTTKGSSFKKGLDFLKEGNELLVNDITNCEEELRTTLLQNEDLLKDIENKQRWIDEQKLINEKLQQRMEWILTKLNQVDRYHHWQEIDFLDGVPGTTVADATEARDPPAGQAFPDKDDDIPL
jgi:hypothetical protein